MPPANHCFNPRSRGGSDATLDLGGADILMFQSTLPWWERHLFILGIFIFIIVSIHAPVVGATRKNTTIFCDSLSFNPRSRGGSDVQWH